VHRELRVPKEFKVQLAQEHKEYKVPRVLKEYRALLVQVRKVRRVQRVLLLILDGLQSHHLLIVFQAPLWHTAK
jgi:hypothetical protein